MKTIQESLWPKPLVDYAANGYVKVKGWVDEGALDSLAAVHICQKQSGAVGSIGEIGVYHGRFFLAFESLRDPTRYRRRSMSSMIRRPTSMPPA